MTQKSLLRITVFFLVLIGLTAITVVDAMEDGDGEVIGKYHADVTGNGKEEQIILKGFPYDNQPAHFEKVLVEIVGDDGKRHSVELNGGFQPQLVFVDLNQDGVKDLFVSVETGGSGAIRNYYSYTIKDAVLTDLSTPEPLVIHSEFLDNYQARITIENNQKTHKFNLKERAEEYENIGLYMNGKLNEPMELIIGDYDRLEPVKVKGKKIGLRGNQVISGAAHADVLGRVESTWIFKDGNWKLLGTKVFERSMGKKKK